MWKKSGAWFYKEVPNYIKPTDNGDIRSPPFHTKTWQHHTNASSSNGGATSHRHRQLPTPPDQNTFVNMNYSTEKLKFDAEKSTQFFAN